MQILLLNYEKGWRGGERQTLMCLQYFRDLGHDVALLTRQDSALANAAITQGITVYTAKNVWHICQILWQNRKNYQIMHAQTANTLTWLALLKPFLRAKIAFTRRTSFPIKKRQWLTALKWKKVDKFYAISQAASLEPTRLGVNIEKIIPSAVDSIPANQDNIQILKDKFKITNKKVIATVAALTPEKDPLTMIKAIDILRQQREDFVFIHFGATGSMMAQASQLVKSLRLQQYYIFAGFRQDITDCYRIMDAFVISSIQEALGSSVLDAFLYKVPVVSTVAGGLKELTAQGRGLACPIEDSKCLAQSINKLLSDEQLQTDLTNNAYNYVINNNGARQMAKQYLKSYLA